MLYQVDAVDVLCESRQITAFWSDHRNRRIQSMKLPLLDGPPRTSRITRTTREASDIRTILTGLRDPRGLAVDWVSRKLYVTDSDRILVATLDGSVVYTLIDADVQKPRSVVVAPQQGLLFWTDWGPPARIETAHMDGNKRRVLVGEGVMWPTGLAVDHPAQRLYWADPKILVIESTRLDGSDRHVVKRFTPGRS